jgi:FkbM family methyltransferase
MSEHLTAARVLAEKRSIPAQWPLPASVYDNLMRVRPAQLISLIKTCLMIRRQTCEFDINGRTRFWVDPVSVFGQHLIRTGNHEPSLTVLIQHVLRKKSVFVDVGASEGYFSVLAAQKQAEVYAFEPQARMRPILEKNFELNQVTGRVHLYRLALSTHVGDAHIHLRPMTNPGASSVFKRARIDFRTERVPTRPLDDVLEEAKLKNIQLVKIDCEGAEHEVIRGSERTLRRQAVRFLSVDYHTSIGSEAITRCDDTHRFISSHGYVLTKINDLCIYHQPGIERELTSIGETRTGVWWSD